MKAIVIYDSKFGNTEKVARALALGLRDGGIETDCMRSDEVPQDKVRTSDLVAIGGPTHNRRVSASLDGWLRVLSRSDVAGKRGFAFDTRNKSRLSGSAAKGIEARMKRLGMRVVLPYASAIVDGTKGPLEPGSEETFRRIGTDIAKRAMGLGAVRTLPQ